MIPTGTRQWRDRRKVEKLLSRSLKTTEHIHHHTDNTLVVCESQTYHYLLHRRTEALEICGHANWRKCKYCGRHDSLDNLKIYTYFFRGCKNDDVYHLKCIREKNRVRTQKWRENRQLRFS